MKHLISATLAVAISLAPLGALAGEPGAPGPMPPMPMMMGGGVQLTTQQHQQLMQIMEQTHQQLDQLHTQARAHILGSLTPAHRTLLAQVVGELAISANPDRDAAAHQLDAALSPAEAQSILATHNALKAQAESIMQNSFKQTQSVFTAQQRAQMEQGGPQHGEHMMIASGHGPEGDEMGEAHETPTAGMILLGLATGDDDHMNMMWMSHP